MAGSWRSSVFTFLRNLCAIFPSTILKVLHHIILAHTWCLFFAHTWCLFFCFFFFFMVAILMGDKWRLLVALMCISLMISDVYHLFVSLLVILMSSLEKYLVKSFSFSVGFFVPLSCGRFSWRFLDVCRYSLCAIFLFLFVYFSFCDLSF
jgi:hypothetical protein